MQASNHAPLTNLRKLCLRDCYVKDGVMPYLAAIKHLQTLSLGTTA